MATMETLEGAGDWGRGNWLDAWEGKETDVVESA